jgi:hypothetical protein
LNAFTEFFSLLFLKLKYITMGLNKICFKKHIEKEINYLFALFLIKPFKLAFNYMCRIE